MLSSVNQSIEVKNIRNTGLIWSWLSIVVIGLDQCTKLIALKYLFPYEPIAMFPGFNVTLAFNNGAAFNFLSTAGGWQRWLLILIAVSISIGLLIWQYKTPRGYTLLNIALALILGGALGNLWDRINLGYVVDFLDFYIGLWHWPAFNIADSAITVGACLLILSTFSKK